MASVRAIVAGALCILLYSDKGVWAQWWNPFGPKDYEECSENAAREAKSREALRVLLSACDSKFPGRRKPGGGYAYFDSRQQRSFDIAGPTPTKAEMDVIEQQYRIYLDEEKRRAAEARRQAEEQEKHRAEDARKRAEEQENEAAKREFEAARRRDEEARQKAETDRRKLAARNAMSIISKEIACSTQISCRFYQVNVTVKNESPETISGVSVGWAFLPAGDTICPKSFVSKHTARLTLHPGDTATMNAHGFDGPAARGFNYCIGIADAEIQR